MLHLYHDETPPDTDDTHTCPECGSPLDRDGVCPNWQWHYEDMYGLEF